MNKIQMNKQIQELQERVTQQEHVIAWFQQEMNKQKSYTELLMRVFLVDLETKGGSIYVSNEQVQQYNKQMRHQLKDGIHCIETFAPGEKIDEPVETASNQNSYNETEQNPIEEPNQGTIPEIDTDTKRNIGLLKSLGNHQASSPANPE